jgi:hypothetical protein
VLRPEVVRLRLKHDGLAHQNNVCQRRSRTTKDTCCPAQLKIPATPHNERLPTLPAYLWARASRGGGAAPPAAPPPPPRRAAPRGVRRGSRAPNDTRVVWVISRCAG